MRYRAGRMEFTTYRIALALVVLVSAGGVLALLLAALTRPAARRAGFVGAVLPLALLAPVVATLYAGGVQMTVSQAGGPTMVATYRSLWQLHSVAWGGVAAVCLTGLLLGLVRRSAAGASDVAASTRRQAAILLFPLFALLLTAALTREVSRGLRLATAVFASDGDPETSRATVDKVLDELGLPKAGSGSLARVAGFIDRGSGIGLFGGGIAAVALVGLALTGAILAWRPGFGPPFQLAASALWLLAAALGVGWGAVADPLRLP